jgi:hypothetical protein
MRFDPDKHRAYQTFESACRARNCDPRIELGSAEDGPREDRPELEALVPMAAGSAHAG